MLRDAGAVLVAKLATGELASGDNWFGGQTKNPWNLAQGSSGSSAGPSSATAAGSVGFAIGTETSGSILSPSARCGLAGLRPTFGRISRYGVMALSWTQDRLGPICRYAEDCAIVMQAIARPDGRDMSVSDIPFNWNAQLDVKKLRVGWIKESFDELTTRRCRRTPRRCSIRSARSASRRSCRSPCPTSRPTSARSTSSRSVFFDEHARAGRMKEARNGGRPSGRLIPAVDYLRSQRVRMMMMAQLAEATAHVDVYVVAANPSVGGRPARQRRRCRATPPRPPRPADAGAAPFRDEPTWPAIRRSTSRTVSSTADRRPTVTFYGRPFGEMEVIALAKAYPGCGRDPPEAIRPRSTRDAHELGNLVIW